MENVEGEITTLTRAVREDLTKYGMFDPPLEGGEWVSYIDIWVVYSMVGHCKEFYYYYVWDRMSLGFWVEEWHSLTFILIRVV